MTKRFPFRPFYIVLLILSLSLALPAFSQPVKPHTFSTLDPVSSSKINANFDTIYQWGSVASAAIELHKADTAAHGATGAVVGTTNTQTLTNKTIGTGSIWNGSAISDAYINTAYSNAAMSAHRNSITSADTRNTNYDPDDRDRGFYADFKGNATDGLSDGGTYHGVLTFRPYGIGTDVSGGYPYQLGLTENVNVWLRKGTSTTAWSGWYKLFHSGHTIPDGNIDSAICRDSELTTHAGTTTGVHGVGGGAVVGTTLAQTLTNKSISGEQINSGTVADARIDSAIARDSEVTSAVSTHAGLTATHGATGAIMGTTNTQTAYSKTLYASSDTSYPYWHKNNDGSGSGLDADALDGANSDFFLNTSSTGQSKSGDLSIYQAIGASDNIRYGLKTYDSAAMAAGVGGQLAFGYKYTTSGSYTEGAIIRMYKANATDGDYSSGLKFQVRLSGANLSTKLRLDPDGTLWNGDGVNKYWHAGNDGASSGLDADTLAGYNTDMIMKRPQSGSFTVAAAGWYRIGYISNTAAGRGGHKFALWITGGNYSVSTLVITAWKDWAGVGSIHAMAHGSVSYWTNVRITYSGDVSYVEVYFPVAMTAAGALCARYDTEGHQGSAGLYTGALSAGGGTVVSSIPIAPGLNVDKAMRAGSLQTTAAVESATPATTADIAFRDDSQSYDVRFMTADQFKAWLINSKIGVVQTSAPASPVDGDIWVE